MAESTDTATSHIRKRYPRNCGNSRYKDRRTFTDGVWLTHTFCGAEVTDRDLGWKDRNTKWAQANACPDCLAAVAEEEHR